MLDRQTIEQILEIAVQAPSGDNSQPWQFKIEGNVISLFNTVGKDATLYNFRERGSYLSHGAVIENISILARVHGLQEQVILFPGEENCVARIELTAGGQAAVDILSKNIPKRATNRKPYSKHQMDEDDRRGLLGSVAAIQNIRLSAVEKQDMKTAAELVSLNERLLFENRPLHDFLFNMIRWSREEERASPGIYVKTMEFPLPLQFLLHYVFSNFNAVELLNTIGLSSLIPAQSSKVYAASSAFFAIIIQKTDDSDYVVAGRAVQRFWLTCEQHGLCAQPVTGIPYLAERVRAGEGSAFSDEHQRAILQTDAQISKLFGLKDNERIAMLMRIGYGSNPTARSLKFPPVISD